jgi:DNA-directed RNA polymerase specialized sigma24 family protein
MNDHQLVNALRTGEPGAVENLFDAYGERLFQFCWFMLRNRDTAQVATRDTFVVAEAHMAGLQDPGALRLWLYALARVECQRRERFSTPDADEPVARPDQRDASARLMAWNAVMELPAAEREALDLTARHGLEPPELALVLGTTQAAVQELLGSARGHLQQALGAELLASKGSHDCAGRADLMRGWAGTLTPQLSERIMAHAASCAVCGKKIPRSVKDTRVYGLLPVPAPRPGLREQVLSSFSDPRQAGYRAFAASRASAFGVSGFPRELPRLARKGQGRRGQPGNRLWAGVAAATVAGSVAVAFAFIGFGGVGGLRTSTSGAGSAMPPGGTQPQPGSSPSATPKGVGGSGPPVSPAYQPSAPGGAPVAANHGPAIPAGGANTRAFIVPQRLLQPGGPLVQAPPGSAPAPGGQVTVTPSSLDLGSRSQGSVTISAVGRATNWSASVGSADLTLSESSGMLASGQSYTLAVTVSRPGGAGGSGVVDVYPGDIQVQVSWAPAAGSSPSLSLSPSPSPSMAPDPSAHPHRHWRPVPDPPQPSTPAPSTPAPSSPAPSSPAPSSPAPSPSPPSSSAPPSTGSSAGSASAPSSPPPDGGGRRHGDVTRR